MDPQSLSIAVGLLVSLLFAELFGLTAGGMVVPGYLALFLNRPLTIVLTIVAAFVTWACVRGLSKVLIVYGKRRIVLMILVGFLTGTAVRGLVAGWEWAAGSTADPNGTAMAGMAVVGYIIPGLIALWMDRQGWFETLAALLTTAAVVRLVLVVLPLEILS